MLNSDSHFMSYGLWVTTIGCVCMAILFAVFSAVFALINTATTPVEAITGIPGLYLWNACARKKRSNKYMCTYISKILKFIKLCDVTPQLQAIWGHWYPGGSNTISNFAIIFCHWRIERTTGRRRGWPCLAIRFGSWWVRQSFTFWTSSSFSSEPIRTTQKSIGCTNPSRKRKPTVPLCCTK